MVRYHGYRLVVPAAWPVYDLATDPTVCVRFNRHAVYLGQPERAPALPGPRRRAHRGDPGRAARRPRRRRARRRRAARRFHRGRDPSAQPADGSSTQLAVPSAGVLVTATWQATRPW